MAQRINCLSCSWEDQTSDPWNSCKRRAGVTSSPAAVCNPSPLKAEASLLARLASSELPAQLRDPASVYRARVAEHDT